MTDSSTCETLLVGCPPPDYMRACGEPAVGRWRRQRGCTKHLLEMKANTREAANVHWDSPNPATGPLFWLCLPIVLVCVVGALAAKVALAWIKTKLPSRRVLRSRRCTWCGWRFWWEPGTFVICSKCVDAESDRLRSLADDGVPL